MRRPLVAANWKMHGSVRQAGELARGVAAAVSSHPGVDVVVFPPALHVPSAIHEATGTELGVGAQNLCTSGDEGAFTGEISAAMVADAGCGWALVGHSERRSLFGESDADTRAKLVNALAAGLRPVLCVGETDAQRQAGDTEQVVGRQLDAALDGLPVDDLIKVTIAYEPVWAIGTGNTASPAQAQAVHAFIRGRLQAKNERTECVRIVYGGSVKAANAAELFSQRDIDGGLVGGASLAIDEFTAIIAAAG